MTPNVEETRGYKLSFTGEKVTQNLSGYGHGGSRMTLYYHCSAFVTNVISMSMGQTVTVIVGMGGGADIATRSRKGGDGFVLIAWGGDIK